MITELFLNSCFSLALNKSTKIKKNKTIYRDILEILNFFKEKQKNEIPINIQNKLECLHEICELKLNDKTDDNIIDSISFGNKFKTLMDFIHVKRNEEVPDEVLSDHVTQIRMRKKLNNVVANYHDLEKFLEVIKSGNFDSIDDIIFNYEKIIKEANFNLMECSRNIGLESSSSLDLTNDDYTPVIEMIKKKYDKTNTIQTGYTIFDQDVFDNGGFEKSRLYIFGGGSGSGKSTLILNFINNDTTTKSKDKNKDKTKNGSVYLYITLENQIDESLLRLYQMMFNKDQVQTLRDINAGIDIKKAITDKFKSTGCTIIFKYFPKYSISCTDIMMHLDDVIDKYGKESIRGLYVDYLDLLKADIANDLYRLELGFITAALKDIAVRYNIPVITVSQLGRSVYRNQDSKSLNMDMMSESIKKIEHADFIALMSKDQVKEDIVHLKVAKNRCGRDNVAIDFNVNFKHYKFLNGLKASNEQRSDVSKDQQIEIMSLDFESGEMKAVKSNTFMGLEEKNEDGEKKNLAW
jgi:replicative DNA helicase